MCYRVKLCLSSFLNLNGGNPPCPGRRPAGKISWDYAPRCLPEWANDLAAQVHDRMPVIVYPECYDAWLTSNDWKYAEDALVPYDAGAMTVQPVNPIVNNARNETEKCIEPWQ